MSDLLDLRVSIGLDLKSTPDIFTLDVQLGDRVVGCRNWTYGEAMRFLRKLEGIFGGEEAGGEIEQAQERLHASLMKHVQDLSRDQLAAVIR